MNKKEEKQTTKVAEKYSKQQIVNSNKYSKYKDILTAVLKEDAKYSNEEVEKIIKNFLERKV